MKTTGINGWRTAHNPPTPAVLDATDQLGMLVRDIDDSYPLLLLLLSTQGTLMVVHRPPQYGMSHTDEIRERERERDTRYES